MSNPNSATNSRSGLGWRDEDGDGSECLLCPWMLQEKRKFEAWRAEIQDRCELDGRERDNATDARIKAAERQVRHGCRGQQEE